MTESVIHSLCMNFRLLLASIFTVRWNLLLSFFVYTLCYIHFLTKDKHTHTQKLNALINILAQACVRLNKEMETWSFLCFTLLKMTKKSKVLYSYGIFVWQHIKYIILTNSYQSKCNNHPFKSPQMPSNEFKIRFDNNIWHDWRVDVPRRTWIDAAIFSPIGKDALIHVNLW